MQNGGSLCWCWQDADPVAWGCFWQPQIAKGDLLWEQIYLQEPDGRPVASPTGAALHEMLSIFDICTMQRLHNAACLHMELLSLGMLIADVLCANMPLLRWAAIRMLGDTRLAATPKGTNTPLCLGVIKLLLPPSTGVLVSRPLHGALLCEGSLAHGGCG